MARKDRENLEQLMASNPKLQEQLEERIAAAVAEARAAWEAEQEVPEEEVAEPSEPEEARRLAEEREALEEEKAAFARQRMEVAVGQELCKRNLPAALPRGWRGRRRRNPPSGWTPLRCYFRRPSPRR